MCTGLKHRGYCYLIAALTYVFGALEIVYAAIMLKNYDPRPDLLWALLVSWIPILVASIFLVVGTCLPDSHKDRKMVLLKIWICVSLGFGLAIVIIKIGIMLSPWDVLGTWINVGRIVVFCCFLILLVSFVYFPCLYAQDLDEEFDL